MSLRGDDLAMDVSGQAAVKIDSTVRHGNRSRVHLLVRGVVQGVGFRPYVYNLARRHGVAGFVMNSPEGAVIEVEGDGSALAEFLAALPAEAPPLARIVSVSQTQMAARDDSEFRILQSEASETAFTLVPPDICVCEECLAEVRDRANRRFDYPFTNCTNCGPRYSIIFDIPYDRDKTTMAEFGMCVTCRAEYEDPGDRRFHAQPNACVECGPRMRLGGENDDSHADARGILQAVGEVLRRGGIVAWKGLGGYQLACDARQQHAVEELRRRKHRSEKPFAVMVGDVAVAERLCLISAAERDVLLSRERPIVLLQRRPDADLAAAVSPGNPMTGVMLPCTPMHDLLFRILRESWGADAVLVMTSGNLSEEPIAIDEADAEARLGGIGDVFVHHDRPIHTRVDDSIVRVFDEEPMLLRRARGYAPRPVWFGLGDAEVLATGAQQKSTFCLTKAGFALPSQHLGDLENYETLQFYEETLERMRKLFHATPKVVAHDLHPGYLSTQLALTMEAERRIGVQHHHAHIASCMAEHQLRGRVLGLAWDGTGFGTDGTIWGGEFLVADLAGFERYAHLRTVLLAGGDAAVREPWRVARSYLHDAFGETLGGRFDGGRFDGGRFDSAIQESVSCKPVMGERIRLVDAMLERRIQTMETSSCGRLFDAVASLIGLRHIVSFEGQAAMALEAIAAEGADDEKSYDFTIAGQSPAQVDMRPMVRQIVRDIDHATPAPVIAARFHNTLIAVAADVCRRMRNDYGLSRVCLSGGCFQNLRLLRGCVATLRAKNFEVFFHRQVPANDGGISLGQAAIACELVQRDL
jgi:hydrogenase maturation protein HypF